MCNYSDLTGNCGDTKTPGVKRRIFFSPADDIDVFPNVRTTTDPGDSVILDGDVIFLANKAAYGLDVVVDSGLGKDTLVGEKGGKSFTNSIDFYVPGTGPVQAEFAKCVANDCLVFFYPQKAGGLRVVGSKDNPAEAISAEFSTLQKAGDKPGGQYSIAADSGSPALFYDPAGILATY